jgi:hypothetical protein
LSAPISRRIDRAVCIYNGIPWHVKRVRNKRSNQADEAYLHIIASHKGQHPAGIEVLLGEAKGFDAYAG